MGILCGTFVDSFVCCAVLFHHVCPVSYPQHCFLSCPLFCTLSTVLYPEYAAHCFAPKDGAQYPPRGHPGINATQERSQIDFHPFFSTNHDWLSSILGYSMDETANKIFQKNCIMQSLKEYKHNEAIQDKKHQKIWVTI